MNIPSHDDSDCGSNGMNIPMESSENYVPQCDPKMKPYVGQLFRSIEDCEYFYKVYGAASGFDVRLGGNKKSTDGTILWKYFYCNREGVKDDVDIVDQCESSKRSRRKVVRRFSCMARLTIRYTAFKGYEVKHFIEKHSHPLFPEAYKHFMNFNRNLDVVHEKFILDCARANIGPVKSFRLFKEMVGSYSNVGCDLTDFKNFSRDLHAFVAGSDAQMMLDKLLRRRSLCSAFSVEYFVDDNNKLKRLFWSDSISRRNYHLFGETLTFDATYGMNRYNMIFTPFTGKDNHGNCVTFGAGLLSNEDVESYSWMLEKFISCMGRTPRMVITDQDPALKIAIERIMPGTRHRLCMWHIMDKVSNKIPRNIRSETDFMKDFNAMVWAENTEPAVFEQNWHEMMETYDLANVDWFSTMFDIRKSWLPAYFRDFPMSGLFRTTSLSESMNSFFGSFARAKADLAEFLLHFDSAMDKQRYEFDKLAKDDMLLLPKPKTELLIEEHARSTFTANVFKKLQHSICKACYRCELTNISVGEFEIIYEVDGFCVTYNKSDKSVSCSCHKFIRLGLICSHMFTVFKNLNVEQIPDAYILNRWRIDACSLPVQHISSDIISGVSHADSIRKAINMMHSKYYTWVGRVDGDLKRIRAFSCYLEKYEEGECSDGKNVDVAQDKESMFEGFYGSKIPTEVSVHPPDPVKTKGSAKRMAPYKEKIVRMMDKRPRRCSKCGEMALHDARNCPKQKVK